MPSSFFPFTAGRRMLFTATVGLLLVVAPCLRSQTVFSNRGETSNGSKNANAWNWIGMGFQTDVGSAYELTSVTLRMGSAFNSSGSFFVGIYANQNLLGTNYPGSSLETLSGTANPAAAGDYTFTSGGLTLQADTTYWLVAGVTSGDGDYRWNATASATFTGDWTSLQTDKSAITASGPGNGWSFSGPDVLQYSVQATAGVSAVPEPGHYAGLVGLLALGFLVWRRRGIPIQAV